MASSQSLGTFIKCHAILDTGELWTEKYFHVAFFSSQTTIKRLEFVKKNIKLKK
jgi:hypothetical protein